MELVQADHRPGTAMASHPPWLAPPVPAFVVAVPECRRQLRSQIVSLKLTRPCSAHRTVRSNIVSICFAHACREPLKSAHPQTNVRPKIALAGQKCLAAKVYEALAYTTAFESADIQPPT